MPKSVLGILVPTVEFVEMPFPHTFASVHKALQAQTVKKRLELRQEHVAKLMVRISYVYMYLDTYTIGSNPDVCNLLVGTLQGNCDNTTSSGDCGYCNSGCSVEPWVLTIADDSDEGLDEELAPLQYDRVTEDCWFHTCIPCLLDSGFTATFSPTVPGKRKKRSFEVEGM